MFGGPNPAISGDAILKALGPNDEDVVNEEQRALDEADLRGLERAAYYGETTAVLEAAATASKPRRTILDRLLRR